MSVETTYHNAAGAFSDIIRPMLGQLLITLLVIVLAALYVRKRALRESKSSKTSPPGSKTATSGAAAGKNAKSNPWRANKSDKASAAAPVSSASGADLRVLVIAAVAMATMLGATLYFLAWQDARSSVTVILHRDNNSQPVIYEVRKRDLGERSFKTVDGTHVRVSANERIEIIGL